MKFLNRWQRIRKNKMGDKMIVIIFIYVFALFFIPFLWEWIENAEVKKENYMQSFKLCLFLLTVLNIPLFLYLLSE